MARDATLRADANSRLATQESRRADGKARLADAKRQKRRRRT